MKRVINIYCELWKEMPGITTVLHLAIFGFLAVLLLMVFEHGIVAVVSLLVYLFVLVFAIQIGSMIDFGKL